MTFKEKLKKIPRIWLTIAGLVLFLPFLLEITGVFASGTWRYKMTVVVETPEGIKTGFAVREISNSASNIKIIDFPEAGNPADFKGEAVAIDLGERGYLFAILGTDPYREFYNTYPNPFGAATVYGIAYYNHMLWGRKKVTLNPESYPQMVMFMDLNDAKSVTLAKGRRFHKEVQKHLPKDNLEELFGQGVKIKAVSIERTNKPVTWRIDNKLPWLDNVRKGSLDGKLLGGGAQLSNKLHYGSFKKDK